MRGKGERGKNRQGKGQGKREGEARGIALMTPCGFEFDSVKKTRKKNKIGIIILTASTSRNMDITVKIVSACLLVFQNSFD